MDTTPYAFKRYEKKYLLTPQQYDALRGALQPYLCDDGYGLHIVNNIYFDTPDYAMIRYSLAHPVYKEKFRLRSYGRPDESQRIYAEIKKKYEHIVYKRRVSAPKQDIRRLLQGEILPDCLLQTQQEIQWLLKRWQPVPQVYIGYDRIACYGRENPELRVTFDLRLRFRTTRLDLTCGDHGQPVLPDGTVIMEIKFPQTSPLWMAHILSQYAVFPSSFSKYGTCFMKHLQRPDLFMRAERKRHVHSAL